MRFDYSSVLKDLALIDYTPNRSLRPPHTSSSLSLLLPDLYAFCVSRLLGKDRDHQVTGKNLKCDRVYFSRRYNNGAVSKVFPLTDWASAKTVATLYLFLHPLPFCDLRALCMSRAVGKNRDYQCSPV